MDHKTYEKIKSLDFFESIDYHCRHEFDIIYVDKFFKIIKQEYFDIFNQDKDLEKNLMSIFLHDYILWNDSPKEQKLMYFIDNNADINFKIENYLESNNLLMIAACRGQLDTLKLLISLGAETKGVNFNKKGFIALAMPHIKKELKEFLKKRKNLKKLDLI